MSWERLERHKGLQWPCWDDDHPGEMFLHGRLWEWPLQGPRVHFYPVEHDPPVERLDEEFPLRLTTGRRLEEYNTGVQTSGYSCPLRREEAVEISPDDARRYGFADGELVHVVSRRGSVVAPVRIDPGLRRGLVFMTFHFGDDVATNVLTVDATDPKSGTAEFKAAAVRLEPLGTPVPAGAMTSAAQGAVPGSGSAGG
jgi:formate dehydrogenase major subunit